MSGEIRGDANAAEVILQPGDYIYVPTGTIHSYAFARNNTQMLVLPTKNFEKFFEYMYAQTDAYVLQEGGEPRFPQEGFAKARAELDLVVVEPPQH